MATASVSPSERTTATVVCIHCPWSASHTADTGREVGTFLRQLLIAHFSEYHPDRRELPIVLGEFDV